jgi:hypothetical protein
MPGSGGKTGGNLRRQGLALLVSMLVIPTAASAQVWSKPFRPGHLPGVQVQWRVYGLDTKTGRNVFEWVFSDVGDTTVEFNYRIETNHHESRTGRISLTPGKKQLSGWLFSGDTLVAIEVDEKPFGKSP